MEDFPDISDTNDDHPADEYPRYPRLNELFLLDSHLKQNLAAMVSETIYFPSTGNL